MFSRIFISIIALLLASLLFNSAKYNACAQPETKAIETKSIQDSIDYYYKLGDKYFHQGYFEKSKVNCLKYLKLLEIYYPNDEIKHADIYITQGVISSLFWKFDKALEFYKNAEQVYDNDNINFKEPLGRIYYSRGKIHKKLGEYQKAEKYYLMALNIFESAALSEFKYNTNFSLIIHVYNSLGVLHYELKEYDIALNYFKKCADLSTKHYKEFLAISCGNIGDCYKEIGLYNEAEKYYKSSIQHLLYKQKMFKYLIANVYTSYSQLCLETKRFDEAYDLLREAFRIYIRHWGANHPQTSECLLNFGKYFEKTGNIDSALYYYQKSIITVVEDFNDLNFYNNPGLNKVVSNLHLIKSLKHKAQTLSNYFLETGNIQDLKTSLNTHDLAIQLIDKIRMGYQTQESKLFLSENEKDTYTDAINTAYRLWQISKDETYMHKAFEYTERSKAAILLAAIRNTEAKSFGNMPDSLLLKENNLMRDIALYKELIYKEKENDKTDENKLKNWEKKLFDMTNEYDNLITFFENSFPKYYSLKYNTRVINPNKLQNNLIHKDVIIEYILTDTFLYSFLIAKNKINLSAQPVDSIFYNDIKYLKSFLQNHYSGNYEEYSQVAFRLYNKLIKPFELFIKNKNLIIIPDENLGYIAFEALLYQPHKKHEHDYGILPYLVRKHNVSYAYSTTLYEYSLHKHKKRNNRFLAVAPGYKTSKDSLNYLPITIKEAKLLAEIMNGSALYENQATERCFKNTLGYFNIIHLTMHAVNDNNEPIYSKLVFTYDKDTIEDGYLQAYEIYNTSFDADLVVLSACNTGSGKLYRGEGILSIARSFLHAGSCLLYTSPSPRD